MTLSRLDEGPLSWVAIPRDWAAGLEAENPGVRIPGHDRDGYGQAQVLGIPCFALDIDMVLFGE